MHQSRFTSHASVTSLKARRSEMIDLYTWTTPNGRKVSIMLEEVGLPYRVHAINIGKDDQFKPEYVKINPNSKIPSIVDPDGPDGKPISMMESGAILIYLARKTGKLLPPTGRGDVRRAAVADVPDGRRRPDVRPDAPFPARGEGAGAVRDRALLEGNAAALRRARTSA